MSAQAHEPKFEHEYLPEKADDDSFAGVGDGGIYCHNCTHGEGDPKWGKHEGQTDPISWGELRHHYPHGTTCDNCYKPLVGERPHTQRECEYGQDCSSFDPQESVKPYLRGDESDEHRSRMMLHDMQLEGIDIDHKPEIPHLPENHSHDFGSQADLDADRFEGEQWAHTYHQRKSDEGHAEREINKMFEHTPEADFLKGNTQGPTHYSSRHQAYGETKAPTQVDTLRDDACPVCGETDAFDGDQCQVCGFVTPPKMFQDPDLDKAKLLDLRNDPATGDPNDGDGEIGTSLPPVDPTAVDEEGGVPGDEDAPVGADAAEIQEQDNDGVVEGDVRTLDDGPADPEDLDENGEVPDVDLSAPQQKIKQGGEPFTPGPNAQTPEEPMDPATMEEAEETEDEEDGGQEAADGQEETGTEGETEGAPGYAGDGTADLFCPACGFEAGASQPLSTSTDGQAPADAGNGMLEGDVCPQCQKATLMGVGELEQMEGQ